MIRYPLSIVALLLAAACSESLQGNEDANEDPLVNFESESDLALVTVNHGRIIPESSDGNTAARIEMASADNHLVAFEITPTTPWDFSENKYVGLAIDIENPSDSSASVYVTSTDAAGQTQIRTTVIPAMSHRTYVVELSIPDLDAETGIRSNPPSWDTNYTPVIWRGGSKKLDLSAIKSLKFDVRGALYDKAFVIDNLRVVYPQEFDNDYLVGLVDEFGQSTRMNFENKVSSVDELVAASEHEQSKLVTTPLPGRSKYGGWADGPHLEATGYFRTKKHDGRWSLVDPDGYLFFSNGIANVRMANTSTMTGYDFDDDTIAKRANGDLTPEDSVGLNRAPSQALPTRRVSSDLRAAMFNWLPTYDEPLGDHFGYRREVHSGPIESGETFSFYRANLARKYQSNDSAVFTQNWRDNTVDRMLSWGFTSFGNWIDPMFYQLDRFPYFANGWIIGDFKTVSSGNDYWIPLPDPFDPLFEERAYVTVRQIATEVQDSSWCIGVFIDNEKSWGMMGSVHSQYGIVINTLARSDADSATKAVFTQWLRDKFTTIDAFNNAWQTDLDSWNALSSGIEIDEFTDAMTENFSGLLELYAAEYFRIVAKAMDELMPNHLYLGARFADWGMTPEVRTAAAKHVDVMSYNFYREGVSNVFWEFLEDIDLPSIIGEFHNGALDSGLLNPGLIHAESQADRGVKYSEYVNSVIDNPYFVGVHWFQYIDSPLTGRALDGENYNVGFVSVTDQPYEPLVNAAKEVNAEIYSRRHKK